MDETTQQNSALVEENAATAKTLEEQAKSMDERVASFRSRSATTRTPVVMRRRSDCHAGAEVVAKRQPGSKPRLKRHAA